MKTLLILSFIFSLNIIFSQTEKNINYLDAITIIKNSINYVTFKNDFNYNDNLKISDKTYSICEFTAIIEKSKLSKR